MANEMHTHLLELARVAAVSRCPFVWVGGSRQSQECSSDLLRGGSEPGAQVAVIIPPLRVIDGERKSPSCQVNDKIVGNRQSTG